MHGKITLFVILVVVAIVSLQLTSIVLAVQDGWKDDDDDDAVSFKEREPAKWTTNKKENIASVHVLANVKTPVGFVMAPLKHFHDHRFHWYCW